MSERKQGMKRERYHTFIVLFLLLVSVLFTGCSSANLGQDTGKENLQQSAKTDANVTVEVDLQEQNLQETIDTENTDTSQPAKKDISAKSVKDDMAGGRNLDVSGLQKKKGTLLASEIPAYAGEISILVNDNQPNFSDDIKTTKSFEQYSELDALGRCQVAFANIGQDIMPTKDREQISRVKPSGWKSAKYTCVQGRYLYNRCHLIGFQLAGENANEKNLITGTRYFNVEGMLPYEEMVAEYVKKTNHHVLYRVTPVYEGDNLLATGVEMEAYSVEDNGAGICFHVFVYNYQPGVKIDYATGDSQLANEEEVAADTEQRKEQAKQKKVAQKKETETENEYLINTNTGKFHEPFCASAKQTKPENQKIYKGTASELKAQGYEACKRCNPN